VGSDFVVNLRLGYDISSAMESDNVMETLNYSQVYEAVKEEITIPSNLLEHVAGRIAKSLHTLFPDITSIDLELTKLNPPMGADGCSASVEIHLINDKTQ
jgi:dihydroneopterin aldolase